MLFRSILTYMGVMADMTVADLELPFLESSRHFHLSSLFLQKGMQRDLPDLCRRLKKTGLTISLDTNDDPDNAWAEPLGELLGIVDVLLPNEDEAMRMTHTSSVEDALGVLAARVPLVAVKCGSRGSIVQAGASRWVAPPLRVEPVDTIGAGDSFNAGFLRAFLQGLSPAECAAAGNVTAALSTMRSGGTESFREPEFRDRFLQEHGQLLSVKRIETS